MIYEYCRLFMEVGENFYTLEKVDYWEEFNPKSSIINIMSGLGAEGWRLVHTVPNPDNPTSPSLFFEKEFVLSEVLKK